MNVNRRITALKFVGVRVLMIGTGDGCVLLCDIKSLGVVLSVDEGS